MEKSVEVTEELTPEEARALVKQLAEEARARREVEALERKPPSRRQIEDYRYR